MSRRVANAGLCAMVVLSSNTGLGNVDDPIETVVVTGTYMPAQASRLTNPVFVIGREQLRTLQKSTISEVLRTVPGVLVSQQGGAGGVTSVSIRGGEPNFTVVMIDGVQVNDPTNTRGGSYDFNNLNIRSVERIEIVRGTQSVVYGSDALAGVINIITVAPAEQGQSSVNAGVGEHGYYQGGYQYRGRSGDVGYALNLQRLESGEQVKGSEYRGTELTARADANLAHGSTVTASLRYVKSDKTSFPEQSGGPEYARSRQLDHSDSDEFSARVGISQILNDSWTTELDISGFQHHDDASSPGVDPFVEVPPNTTDSTYRRSKARWLNHLRISESIAVVLGVDGRWEHGDSSGGLDFFGQVQATDYELDRTTGGLFADFSYSVDEGWVLQASVRQDKTEGTAGETTGRLGIRIPLRDGLQLFSNIGSGFKLPSFFALGHALVGNPLLQPETALSRDLGIEWQWQEQLNIQLTGFYNTYKNLIDFDDQAFTNVNRDEVVTRGAELELQWSPMNSLDLRAHGTYTDIDVVDTDRTLAGRPEWKLGLLADWRFLPAWKLGLNYEWNDEVYASSLYTGTTVGEQLDPWHRIDANLRWQLNPALALSAIVENLLDADYQEDVGFAGAGRWLRVALEWHF